MRHEIPETPEGCKPALFYESIASEWGGTSHLFVERQAPMGVSEFEVVHIGVYMFPYGTRGDQAIPLSIKEANVLFLLLKEALA